MQTPAVLDFEAILAPIPGDNPAGVYLREEDRPLFDSIRSASRQARTAEDRATPESGSPLQAGLVEWRTAHANATLALTTRTKDLEIASYFIESLLRLSGMAGLRDGFRVVRELCERYWDQLYPLPEDDDIWSRVVIFAGLNGSSEQPGTLPRAVDYLRLAEPPGGEAMHFTDYHDAVGRARKNPDGPDALADLKTAVQATPTMFYQTLAADIAAASDEFARMTTALDERCGSKSPGSSDIARKLEKCADIVQELVGSRLAEAEAAPAIIEGNVSSDSAPTTTRAANSREGALRQLLELASFFETTEPQSVIPFALRQIVRWGKLSLPQLMMELIGDSDAREKFFSKVGIEPPESQSS